MRTTAVKLTKYRRDQIRDVIQYNWADERADYREHQEDGQHHIFLKLVALDNWVNGTKFTPADHLKIDDAIGAWAR